MPKASIEDAQKLAELSTDCSFLLSHLIRQNGDKDDKQAKGTLLSILGIEQQQKPKLLATPVGWYGALDHPQVFEPGTSGGYVFPNTEETKGVCFTDSTLAGLRAHCEIFKVKYGLAFDRDYLFNHGANPCLNIRNSLFKKVIHHNGKKEYKVYNHIPIPLLGYVNIINEAFDATHEREWRILGDFEFENCDIKFVFCPEKDFEEFSKIQKNAAPALFDLAWLKRI